MEKRKSDEKLFVCKEVRICEALTARKTKFLSGNMYWSESDNDKKLAFWDLELKKFKKYWYGIWPGFVVGMEF